MSDETSQVNVAVLQFCGCLCWSLALIQKHCFWEETERRKGEISNCSLKIKDQMTRKEQHDKRTPQTVVPIQQSQEEFNLC